MGFHPRKLFHPYHDSSDATMEYGTNCIPIPSPLHPPISLPEAAISWFSSFRDGDHIDRINLIQIVMIAIASTVGVVMFFFTLSRIIRYFYSKRHNLSRRNAPILFDIHGESPFSDDEGPAIVHPIWFIPTVGLQQSIIDSITVFKYRRDERLIEGTECLVCLGEFQEDESLRLLPKCSHAFHVPCIDTWLSSHKNCPLCRAPIVHDTGSDGSGSGTERTIETDSSFSGQNEHTQIENFSGEAESSHVGETESSGLWVGDDDSCVLFSEDGRDNGTPDKILPVSDKMNCGSPIPIGSAASARDFEEEMQPMSSVSVDSSSALMIFRDVVDLNSDVESSVTNLDDKKVLSSQDMAIGMQGRENSTICKIGHASQKGNFSLGRSSSHSRRFIFSRRCMSQSSTLPL